MTEPKRDHWGRYKLPHPDDPAKEVAWTRATTFADSVEDTYGLTKWKQRGTAVGIGQRPDLLALAQSLDMENDKKSLDDVCEQALMVAKANERSNLGTALHRMTERLDRGERFTPPPAYRADMAAYFAVKEQYGMETHPSYIERITVVPEFTVAGTMDRIVRMAGQVYIADVKTGDLKYGWGKIAIQLALYAHGKGLWNPQTATYDNMPPVNQDKGIVIQIPVGQGTCKLWWVDIAAGWQAAQVCKWVRDWRKNKQLATTFE